MNVSEVPCVERAAAWLGIPWSADQGQLLAAYAGWLADEGMALGGIGPAEVDRLWTRHVCDSLVFGKGLSPGDRVLDVGTGVGLPGIPLLVAFPDVRMTLLDRSGRRIDALHRVCRALGISPQIVHGDIGVWADQVERLVFRGSLRIEAALTAAARLLADGGEAWFGLGRGAESAAVGEWRRNRTHLAESSGLAIGEIVVPGDVLDSPVWLLRIAHA